MDPLLSFAAFIFFAVHTIWCLVMRRIRWKWWMIHREDHPTLYWFHVGIGLFLVVVFPLYCLEGWREALT
jgi:hypothetical protein